MFRDPCALVLLWPKKTSMVHIWNGALVVLINIWELELMVPFYMGALTINALFGEDALVLFLRFGYAGVP